MAKALDMARITGEVFTREIEFERKCTDKEKRTAQLAFSSETPVERWFGMEILDHSVNSVNLDRLNRGAALLLNHDPDKQIGVVESASVDSDKKGRAIVRFSNSDLGREIFDDVDNGIRRLVSVGYRVTKMDLDSEVDGVKTYRASGWEPREISIVSVPADASVGIGRSVNTENAKAEDPPKAQDKPIEEKHMKDDTSQAPSAATVQEPAETLRAERKRISEIHALTNLWVKSHPQLAQASKRAIEEGTSLEDYRGEVLVAIGKATPAIEEQPIGMSQKEQRSYSLVRAIRCLAEKKPLDGLEREASDAMAKMLRREPEGFFIPTDMMRASLLSNVYTAAGALVGTDLMAGNLIELLRNQMFVVAMGARSLSGLSGNVAIPRVTGGATAYWLNEDGTNTATTQSVGQLALVPHRLGAATAYSKQLLAQSSIDVESFVRSDLMSVLAIAKDLAALNGSGVSGEPLGVIGTTGVCTPITWTAYPTTGMLFSRCVDAETAVATSNAATGRLGFLTNYLARGAAKKTAKWTNAAGAVWENDTMNGYPARATNQVPNATGVIFGNWDDMILADWSGIDTVVDPYSLSTTNQIRVVINLMTDVGIRHAQSFVIGVSA